MTHFTHNNIEVTLSNPRREATFEDWPFGSKRVKCRFYMEVHEKKGERICRVTENKTRTGWNAPKMMTYSRRQLICDGSDGKTYLLCYDDRFGGIHINTHDMMTAGNVYRDSSPEIYADLTSFFLLPQH